METLENPPESLPPWMLAASSGSAAAESVRAWWERAERVTPAATVRAWQFDWAVFHAFCGEKAYCPLPASEETVASFVDGGRAAGKKPATIRRYLSTIALAHRVAKLPNPCVEEAVLLAVKGLYKESPARQRQARGLGWAELKQFIETAGKSVPATRERALVSVAYDTMARRSELVAFNLEDFEFLSDGTGRVLIRRSKADQMGEGHQAYLSRETVRWLKHWLETAYIKEGAVFRRVVGRGTATTAADGKGRIGGRLNVDAVAQAFKRVAAWIGIKKEEVEQVSGHSIRVGATQDLLALNIDLASVMQAGRWKTNRMPMRYGEHVLAARGGMARAAGKQGRDG